MTKFLPPMVAFGLAGIVSLSTFGFSTEAEQSAQGELLSPPPIVEAAFGDRYQLAELDYLKTTLYYLEESYVEPERIDYDKMYIGALEAVERKVPAAMFRREPGGNVLHLEVGDFRTVLQVQPVDSGARLYEELARIAQILGTRLTPEDVPLRNPNAKPEDPVRAAYSEVEYALINGMLGTLDPHSILLPPAESKDMEVENQGHFGGLGITIVERDGTLTVEYPLKDTPAMEAGLQPDDKIVRIDGESTINMGLDDAVKRLRGPVGAPVLIEIMRDGLSEPKAVEIVRAEIKLNPVEATLLEGDVGYVSISAFHAEVAEGLDTKLTELAREAVGGDLKGLVLDLRGNPGGFLNQAVKVSEAFLDGGVIVSTVNGDGRKLDEQTARAWGSEPTYPIVVIVDARSASASEIVAGALRNNDRAVIIGERSFGKGSVQNLRSFNDHSKLKITTSKYLTPGDRSIQSVGIPADIELVPTIAEMRDVDGEQQPFALVHWRERVSREADLDKHLDHVSARYEEPAYRLRYMRSSEGKRRKTADVDVDDDVEVQFAREIILTSPSARRSDMLASVAPVVSRYQRKWDGEIKAAFKTVDLDWADGPSQNSATLDVDFAVEGDALQAGDEHVVTLTLKNTGDEPLYRLVATSSTDVEFLDGREFVYGKLSPGESREYTHTVRLVDGYPSELTPVTFQFRDTKNKDLLTEVIEVPVQGKDLPAFSWSYSLETPDDGDIAVGGRVDIVMTVENVGQGSVGEPFARIKNQSGRAIDILTGTAEPGVMRDADGNACEVLEPGVESGTVIGDASANPERVEKGDRPKYAPDCSRSLEPGEKWTGRFELEIKEQRDAFELELQIGDAAAYDHASIMRAGFYPYFTQREIVSFGSGAVPAGSSTRVPPTVRVTREPAQMVDSERLTLSGVVTDDQGLAHVMVFHGDQKVFYQGSGRRDGLKSVPFTSDVTLEPGLNTIAILATDMEGQTATASVVTYYRPPPQTAQTAAADEATHE